MTIFSLHFPQKLFLNGIDLSLFENPRTHHSTMVLMGLGGALNESPIMPRGVKLSDDRLNKTSISTQSTAKAPSISLA